MKKKVTRKRKSRLKSQSAVRVGARDLSPQQNLTRFVATPPPYLNQHGNHQPPRLPAVAVESPPEEAELRNRKKSSRKKAKKTGGDLDSVNTNKPLEFPTTPETILAHHKKKPFLSKNEEWLIVELNEFECLVDSLDIIKQIATHSKFFEVEPDELWEEFFEFVEEMPTYDDIINLDVWQEFRDTKYPC